MPRAMCTLDLVSKSNRRLQSFNQSFEVIVCTATSVWTAFYMQMTCQDQLGTVMLLAKLEKVVPKTCSDCCTDLSHVSQPVH